MPVRPTTFGSLDNYVKGRVEVVEGDPKHYAFSNVFEVASRSQPYEKVAVGKNFEYVLEAIRAEGMSGWRAACNDEFALVMDGEVEITLCQLNEPHGDGKTGSVAIEGEPVGRRMGRIRASRGHMTLLPKGSAYQFNAPRPSVILLQTIEGSDTIFRWSEICQVR